ncbi:hypothetical protein MOO46_04010 [Apilactobacillus apisilvae]|uniref:Uncharacterized protein n=1 Tax=Apilactobacillus apisilvae TaxID=2923364 RepID=A0ABY4PFJ6_9LACO|nr:hypothetical protein [Apilactobacillus apisilvae]UQS84428.1 hypothetical protein MOO46_04010 [Apilactobacillus apisilvae]
MKSFEGIHPILTNNFRLDWLTEFKLQDVIDFQKKSDPESDIASTGNFINAAMIDVMRKKALLWGIENKETHQFIGMGGIANISEGDTAPTIYLNIIEIDTTLEMEILNRIHKLAKDYWPTAKFYYNIQPTNEKIERHLRLY